MTTNTTKTPDEYDNLPVNEYGGEGTTLPPFRLKVGRSPVVLIHQPDAGTVMDIEESGSLRNTLRLFLDGDAWSNVREFIEKEHPDTLVAIVRDVSRHFHLDEAAPTNRAARRRRRG